MRAGLTTHTHSSGAPLPLPIRVSSGFFVTGLSGNTRIQIFPPRLMWRVMAIRPASIWRAVTQPASSACSPKSPNEIFWPRVASPRRRPRCCFLNFTFFGIIMMRFLLVPQSLLRTAARAGLGHLTLVDPHLHADRAVGRVGRGHTVVDVRLQRVQRQTAVLIPLGARDLGAVQTAADAHLDSFRAEAEGRLHRLLHRAAECDAALELRGDVLRHQLRVELRTLDLLDIDVDLAVDELLQLVAELVDFGSLAADDDPRARRVDVDAHLVRRALDVDLRDSGVREALLEILAKLQIAMQRLGVALAGKPAGVPSLVESEPKSVRVDLLTQDSLRYFRARARPALAAPSRALTALTSSET